MFYEYGPRTSETIYAKLNTLHALFMMPPNMPKEELHLKQKLSMSFNFSKVIIQLFFEKEKYKQIF